MSPTEGKLSYAHRQGSDGMYATELFDQKGETVAIAAWYPVPTWDGVATNRDANARRLAACWNALDGVPTEWLENYVAGGAENLMQENAKLKAEVERSLEAVRAENAACDMLRRNNDKLHAEVERLRKDAATLNWLLAGGIYKLPCQVDERRGFQVDLSPETIDAEMKEKT